MKSWLPFLKERCLQLFLAYLAERRWTNCCVSAPVTSFPTSPSRCSSWESSCCSGAVQGREDGWAVGWVQVCGREAQGAGGSWGGTSASSAPEHARCIEHHKRRITRSPQLFCYFICQCLSCGMADKWWALCFAPVVPSPTTSRETAQLSTFLQTYQLSSLLAVISSH